MDRCDLCHRERVLVDDYCAPCRRAMDIIDADDSIPCGRKAAEAALQIVADWEREADVAKQMDAYAAGDLPEIPVLEPITVRPVELNAVLWDEWKRIAEKMA